jgi:hypothetical protein
LHRKRERKSCFTRSERIREIREGDNKFSRDLRAESVHRPAGSMVPPLGKASGHASAAAEGP